MKTFTRQGPSRAKHETRKSLKKNSADALAAFCNYYRRRFTATKQASNGRKLGAVVGGGSCGIYVTKACLEHGLRPTCFEAAHDVGGVWRSEGPGAVAYDSLHTNSSVCSSALPLPALSHYAVVISMNAHTHMFSPLSTLL